MSASARSKVVWRTVQCLQSGLGLDTTGTWTNNIIFQVQAYLKNKAMKSMSLWWPIVLSLG